MIVHPRTGMPIRSVGRLKDDAEWLCGLLKQEGIEIPSGSILEDAALLAMHFPEWTDKPETIPAPLNLSVVLSRSLFISLFARILQAASNQADFGKIKRLLPNLALANPILTDQVTVRDSTEPRNLVFELEIAGLCLAAGYPTESRLEPDVVLTTDPPWNIPCKMIYSKEPVTIANSIDKALRQGLKPENGYCFAALGVSNRLDHSHFLPVVDAKEASVRSHRSVVTAHQDLTQAVDVVIAEIQKQATTRFHWAKDNHRFRGLIVLAHTITVVDKAPVTVTTLKLLTKNVLFEETQNIEGPEETLCQRLNDAGRRICAE